MSDDMNEINEPCSDVPPGHGIDDFYSRCPVCGQWAVSVMHGSGDSELSCGCKVPFEPHGRLILDRRDAFWIGRRATQNELHEAHMAKCPCFGCVYMRKQGSALRTANG